jgi:hypothetical protein
LLCACQQTLGLLFVHAGRHGERSANQKPRELRDAFDSIEGPFDVAPKGSPRELRSARDRPKREDEAVSNRSNE